MQDILARLALSAVDSIDRHPRYWAVGLLIVTIATFLFELTAAWWMMQWLFA